MVWSCADIERKGRDVGDCTSMVMRHHGAQSASPLNSERRRGGRMRYLVVVAGLSGWVRYRAQGMDCRRMGLQSTSIGVKATVLARSSPVHLVAGWMESRTCSRTWRGGESSAADFARSC